MLRIICIRSLSRPKGELWFNMWERSGIILLNTSLDLPLCKRDYHLALENTTRHTVSSAQHG